jgi:phage gp16-like protein
MNGLEIRGVLSIVAKRRKCTRMLVAKVLKEFGPKNKNLFKKLDTGRWLTNPEGIEALDQHVKKRLSEGRPAISYDVWKRKQRSQQRKQSK